MARSAVGAVFFRVTGEGPEPSTNGLTYRFSAIGTDRTEKDSSGQNSLFSTPKRESLADQQGTRADTSGHPIAAPSAARPLPDDRDLEGVVSDLRSGWATLSAAEKAEWISRAAMVRKIRSEE
jgi:hypothetical protein